MICIGPYVALVSVLSGGYASSREPVDYNGPTWIVIDEPQECRVTLTNNDSVVLRNVTLVNGLLGFRVEWNNLQGQYPCNDVKLGSTNTLLASALAYSPFSSTVTFDPGDLTFVFQQECE